MVGDELYTKPQLNTGCNTTFCQTFHYM